MSERNAFRVGISILALSISLVAASRDSTAASIDNRGQTISEQDPPYGLYVENDGPVTIDNREEGSIVGTTPAGGAVRLFHVTNVTVNNNGLSLETPDGGSISGAGWGLRMDDVGGFVSIDNSFGGSIEGKAGDGIAITNWLPPELIPDLDVRIDNTAGSVVGTGNGIILEYVHGDVDIINDDGKIQGGEGTYGILLRGVTAGETTIDNDGGSITGQWGGIYAIVHQAPVIVNNGSGTIDSALGSGIVVTAYATGEGTMDVTNGAGGRITGAESGIGFYGVSGIIRNAGLIQGAGDADAGPTIDVETLVDDETTMTIENQAGGVIRGIAGSASDLIVRAVGGAIEIDNAGLMLGRLALTDADDVVTIGPTGLWSASGETAFGGGADALVNDAAGRILFTGDTTVAFGDGADRLRNGGLLQAASDAAQETSVRFDALETFDNRGGVLSLVDGGTHDVAVIGAGTSFQGAGGIVAFDVNPARHTADLLRIEGDVSNETTGYVAVSSQGGWAAYTAPIPLIEVTGETRASDFALLEDSYRQGFFAYDLRLEPGLGGDESTWVLTSSPTGQMDPLPRLTGAARQLWYDGMASWSERMVVLRDRVGGFDQVASTDVSAPADDGAATVDPASGVGVWGRAIGSSTTRDGGYDQSSWGFLGGIDVPVSVSADDALIVGVLLGYASSDVDFGDTDGSARLSGPSVGAYATFLRGPFHLDLLAKADFFSVDYDTLGDSGAGDGSSLGARLEGGYRFDLGGGAFVEPRGSITYVRSDLGSIDILGTTVGFDDGESLQTTVGLRAGTRFDAGGVTVAPHVALDVGYEFLGEDKATLTSGGVGFDTVDGTDGAFGEIGLGVSLLDLGGGLSAYVDAAYRFHAEDDYDSLRGSVGLRVNW